MWHTRLELKLLNQAIERGDIQAVLKQMTKGADVNSAVHSATECTPLELALFCSNQALVTAMLNHTRFKFTRFTGRAVFKVIVHNRSYFAPLLLSKHTDPSIDIDEWRTDGKSILSTVLDKINHKNMAEEDVIDLIRLLLDHGADPHKATSTQFANSNNISPFSVACSKGYKKIANVFTEHIRKCDKNDHENLRSQLIKAIQSRNLAQITEIAQNKHFRPSQEERWAIDESIRSQDVQALYQLFTSCAETQTDPIFGVAIDHTEKSKKDQATQVELFIKNVNTVHSTSTPSTLLYERRMDLNRNAPLSKSDNLNQATQTFTSTSIFTFDKGVQAPEIPYERRHAPRELTSLIIPKYSK